MRNFRVKAREAIAAILLLCIFAGGFIFTQLQSNKQKVQLTNKLKAAADCNDQSITLIISKVGDLEKDAGRNSEETIASLIQAFAGCRCGTEFEKSSFVEYIKPLANRVSAKAKIYALIALGNPDIGLTNALLSSVDPLSNEIKDLIYASMTSREPKSTPIPYALTNIMHPAANKLYQAQLEILKAKLPIILSGDRPSQWRPAASALAQASESLVNATELQKLFRQLPNDAVAEISIKAAIEMRSGALAILNAIPEEAGKSLEYQNAVISRLIPGGSEAGFDYQAVLMERPIEGQVVLRSRSREQFLRPGYYSVLLANAGNVKLQSSGGGTVVLPLYLAYPVADAEKFQENLKSAAASIRLGIGNLPSSLGKDPVSKSALQNIRP